MVEGQLRDSTLFLHNENQSTIKVTDLPQRESTQGRWGGRDGRREPYSGLGYTQDYRLRWSHENCVDQDSASQWTEQPAGHKRRAGGRPAGDRIPEETGRHRDSRKDIPWKRALFTSDGPDSTTSDSDIPEGHADRPPEVKYSERLTSAKRQDEDGTEVLCSPHMELKMIQLQRDVENCRSELELARKQTPAVTLRPQRRSGFTSTPVPRYSGKSTGNSTARCSKPLYVRMAGTMSRRPYSCYPIWKEMHSTLLYWFRSLEG